MNQRIRPDVAAFALMVMLCALWGLQQIAVTVAMSGISPKEQEQSGYDGFAIALVTESADG